MDDISIFLFGQLLSLQEVPDEGDFAGDIGWLARLRAGLAEHLGPHLLGFELLDAL